ncbi:MAG: hypothetical protein ACT4OK_15005 [Gemmobacter sp.]
MVRLRGGLLVLCAALLGGFGLWLMYLTMGWAYPVFVPPEIVPTAQGPQGSPQDRMLSAPGLVALFLLAFGAVAGLLGLGMLVIGRRSGVLFNLVLALVAVFVVVAWAVKLSGNN